MCRSYFALLSTVHSSRITTRTATSPTFATFARRQLHWQQCFDAWPQDCCSEGANVKIAPTSTYVINMAKRCSYICTSTSSRLLGPCIYPLHSSGVRSNICATASSDTSCTFTRVLSVIVSRLRLPVWTLQTVAPTF